MTDLLDPSIFLPLLLYAETHYRFKYFFSFLKKKEPEIIADAPSRVDPGKPIPILILAKDAHLFPCTLANVLLTIRNETRILEKQLLPQPIRLTKRLWWKVVHVSPKELSGMTGRLFFDVAFEVHSNGRTVTYRNDNYRTSSHRPLEVYVSPHPLPSFKGLYFGDAHTHSDYTDDQVEFGSPLQASVELCKSMGLSFFCVADHSYDLDDLADDYLANDPALPKWNRLHKEIALLNGRDRHFKIIPGEEISCRNKAGRNVHLLLFGSERFYPGSGDSAERWLRTRSEHSVLEISRGESGSVFAAHPMEEVPFLQRLLLNRGMWKEKDFRGSGITGLQIVNGDYGSGFSAGYESWISALLRGERLVILAGNDAHGNFSRFRQIGIPFFRIREKREQIFGQMRTAIFLRGALSQWAILQALCNGRSIVTDGPVARMFVRRHRARDIDAKTTQRNLILEIEAVSSPEFGALSEVKILLGVPGQRKEKLFGLIRKDLGFRFHDTLEIDNSQSCYIRMEVRSSGGNSHHRSGHRCLTNPIWLYL